VEEMIFTAETQGRGENSKIMEAHSQAQLNLISGEILTASIAVHKEMGPGLLESIYQQCLVKELTMRGVQTSIMVPIPLVYRGQTCALVPSRLINN